MLWVIYFFLPSYFQPLASTERTSDIRSKVRYGQFISYSFHLGWNGLKVRKKSMVNQASDKIHIELFEAVSSTSENRFNFVSSLTSCFNVYGTPCDIANGLKHLMRHIVMETIVINSDLTKCVEEAGFVDLLPRYFQLKMGHTQKFQSVKFLIMQEMTFSVKSSLIL